jgi:hypothetical protein
MFLSLCQQVDRGFQRRDEDNINLVFKKYSTMIEPTTKEQLIPTDSLKSALSDLNIVVDDASQLFTEMDVNNDGGLSLEEFTRTVRVAYERVLGPYELWARSLPLNEILADALLKPTDTADVNKDKHLRFVSNFQEADVDVVVKAFSKGLKRMLMESCKVLNQAYIDMDKQKPAVAGGKFKVFTAMCGRIKDFHVGMTERVGNCPICLYIIVILCCFAAINFALGRCS